MEQQHVTSIQKAVSIFQDTQCLKILKRNLELFMEFQVSINSFTSRDE